MIYKQPTSKYWWVKIKWDGKTIRRSTKAINKKDAKTIESTIRSELARGNWGVLDDTQEIPTLRHFLEKDFKPYLESKKASTKAYYEYGVSLLNKEDFSRLQLDRFTDKHAAGFAAKHTKPSRSTINCALRTLRRALGLAVEWGQLEKMPKIRLAQGEHQRDRVLGQDEITRYLGACRQPWQDAATMMLWTGMRPDEVFCTRWENITFGSGIGTIRVTIGKTKAAKRTLPMVPKLYAVLQRRWRDQDEPSEGWVFPSESEAGHLTQGSAKNMHAKAIADVNREAKEKELTPVKWFPPYVIRHTALTRIGQDCDAFALARIAGHSSITITQRYCHPQADAIQTAFSRLAVRHKGGIRRGHTPAKPKLALAAKAAVNA